MASLTDYQADVTSTTPLRGLDGDDVAAFADVLAHGAAVAYEGDRMRVTMGVIARTEAEAAQQARMLCATATLFALPIRSLRWEAKVTPYADLDPADSGEDIPTEEEGSP